MTHTKCTWKRVRFRNRISPITYLSPHNNPLPHNRYHIIPSSLKTEGDILFDMEAPQSLYVT